MISKIRSWLFVFFGLLLGACAGAPAPGGTPPGPGSTAPSADPQVYEPVTAYGLMVPSGTSHVDRGRELTARNFSLDHAVWSRFAWRGETLDLKSDAAVRNARNQPDLSFPGPEAEVLIKVQSAEAAVPADLGQARQSLRVEIPFTEISRPDALLVLNRSQVLQGQPLRAGFVRLARLEIGAAALILTWELAPLADAGPAVQ